ncbi:MAG: hypothetical protein ACPW60_14250 [Methylohalobius sp. ZOD2]
MITSFKKACLFIFCFLLSGYAKTMFADTVVLDFSMEESSFVPRTGTFQVLTKDSAVSPYGGIEFDGFDTSLYMQASWDSICGSNISLAGGEASGWVLGPVIDSSFPDFDVDLLHDQLRESVGLGPGAVSSMLYAVFNDSAVGVPGAGSAKRISCSGSSEDAAFALSYVFLWENATFFDGKGYYIGDLIYMTEIGTQLYFLYNDQKLLP